MKTIGVPRDVFLVFVLLLAIVQQGFTQGEMSSKFIGDRFDVYNGQVNYKLWSIAEFLMANSSSFNISAREQVLLRRSKEAFFERQYLFEEEAYWVEHTERELSLAGGSALPLKEEVEKLLTWLSKNLADTKLNMYQDSRFVKPVFEDEIDSTIIKNASRVLIKEAWYYDKVSNGLRNHIIGLGVKTSGRELWWYYPKLKSRYRYDFPKSRLVSLLGNASFLLESNRFENYDAIKSDFKLLLLESVYRDKKTVMGNEQVCDTLSFFGGSLVFNYQGSKLFGEYEWRDLSGKLKEQGVFEQGLRVGEVRSYYESGEVKFVKNYDDGFLAGEQLEFAEDGEVMQQYHFENKVISNVYRLKEKGFECSGTFKKGLCVGDWNYEIVLPHLWQNILKRNSAYFDKHYKFESSWTSANLLSDSLRFKANYKYFKGDNCLNKQCLSVTIKSH